MKKEDFLLMICFLMIGISIAVIIVIIFADPSILDFGFKPNLF